MKKVLTLMMAFCLLLAGSVQAENTSDENVQAESEQAESELEKSDTLVVYFSCTGTTRGVAERLADVTGADLYEIIPAVPYTEEDLNYNDRSTRATTEQDHPDTRPEIGGEDVDLTGYTTVYLGYPIWWGQQPRILCTFVESHDFTGMTVIPFCTSGSSGIGTSGEDLAEKAGTGTWLDGTRHSGDISEEELKAWVDGLKKNQIITTCESVGCSS